MGGSKGVTKTISQNYFAIFTENTWNKFKQWNTFYINERGCGNAELSITESLECNLSVKSLDYEE